MRAGARRPFARNFRMPSMKNLVFLDTELTDLLDPRLLSVGMVTWEGREHYVELDPACPASATTFAKASDFVRTCGVLDQWNRLTGAAASAPVMGRRTADWLLGIAAHFDEPLLIAFDHADDYALVEECIRDSGLWGRVREVVRPRSVNEVNGIFECNLAAEYAYEALRRRDLARHHALADAHALRAAYVAYTTGKRVRL